GLSRIALGAHYLSDVLGGIVLGIFWLMLCFWLSGSVRRRTFSIASPVARHSSPSAELSPSAGERL
ncbi:MAG: phosphatase PAP2 family protein, partial [Chthoniobacterales bacterium]